MVTIALVDISPKRHLAKNTVGLCLPSVGHTTLNEVLFFLIYSYNGSQHVSSTASTRCSPIANMPRSPDDLVACPQNAGNP